MSIETISLRPPRHRVRRRAVAWWTLRAVTGGLFAVAAFAVPYWFVVPARPWLGPLVIAVGGFGVAYAAVAPIWCYRVHRWEATDEAVYTATGWFLRECRVAPISRIQTVDTARGPYQQLLGLATVTVTTASSQGAVKLPGLDAAEADEVSRRLTEIAQITPGDAT